MAESSALADESVLPELIQALSDPAAYPHETGRIEVIQTHISVVFLAGEHVYKLKKPLDLGFLDYSTLAKRQACCEAEVELNRRLAPTVYLGVVPISRSRGRIMVGGGGRLLEYAVHMRRLPAEQTFSALADGDRLRPRHLERLATKLAAFHARAERSPRISTFGEFPVVAGNARENFAQLRELARRTPPAGTEPLLDSPSQRVLERLEEVTEAALGRMRSLIKARAQAQVPCDTHGDLRLEHVYLLPEAGEDDEPDALVVVDCIEFNERFRYGDPVGDVAFLAMDLVAHGHAPLAEVFERAWFTASGDLDGRPLWGFYMAYRATVRAKVKGFKAYESEVPAAERALAIDRARRNLLQALVALSPPQERPCLVLLGGLPASGKSTLAAGLVAEAGFQRWVRSDQVRKTLASREQAQGDLYTPAWSQRTYAACRSEAAAGLRRGERVVVDASFASDLQRREFVELARRLCVPCRLLLVETDPDATRARLGRRAELRDAAGQPGPDASDPSDADWQVYLDMRQRWEPLGAVSEPITCSVDGGGDPADVLLRAREALHAAGMD